jgi:hypothetical protein
VGTAHKIRREKMRPMRIAVFACVAVAAILLLGEIVWAGGGHGAVKTEFTWLWCQPNTPLADGYDILMPDGGRHRRGREASITLCMTEGCTCDDIRNKVRPPDGYKAMFFDANGTPVAGGVENMGPMWGDMLVFPYDPLVPTIITGPCSGALKVNPAAVPLWDIKFTGWGDGYGYRSQWLTGVGVGVYEGYKLKGRCDTIQPDPAHPKVPNTCDHVCHGWFLGPLGDGFGK